MSETVGVACAVLGSAGLVAFVLLIWWDCHMGPHRDWHGRLVDKSNSRTTKEDG